MKLLLDTHIFLWCISEPDRLAADQRRQIESLANTVYVSAISVAEIAIKASLGKLTVAFDPNEEIRAAGFEPLHFTGRDAARLQTLPFHHRDPFDRMLIAQALIEGLTLVTDDEIIPRYAVPILGRD